jgi:hypothetical protein
VPDLDEAAMKEIGVQRTAGADDQARDRSVDGAAFDPAQPEAYAKGFAVKLAQGLNRHEEDPMDSVLMPLVGIVLTLLAWHWSPGERSPGVCPMAPSRRSRSVGSKTCPARPSPGETRKYVLEPFAKREQLHQGILRFTWYSLVIVAKGYAIALLLGNSMGSSWTSATFSKTLPAIRN